MDSTKEISSDWQPVSYGHDSQHLHYVYFPCLQYFIRSYNDVLGPKSACWSKSSQMPDLYLHLFQSCNCVTTAYFHFQIIFTGSPLDQNLILIVYYSLYQSVPF
jgi:hypothetical protein